MSIMRIATISFGIGASLIVSATTAAAQRVNTSMLSGSWRGRAASAAVWSLTFDDAGHVLVLRDGVARAYAVASDTASAEPGTMRLALRAAYGQADSLTVRLRGRTEIEVTSITHPKAPGDTIVRYVRANPQVSRELRARLEQALHP